MKQTSMTRSRLRTVDLAYAALFAVLLMVCAWINIPLTVPFIAPDLWRVCSWGPWGAGGGHWAILAYLLLGWWACRCSQAFREARAFCWAPPAVYPGFSGLGPAVLGCGLTGSCL